MRKQAIQHTSTQEASEKRRTEEGRRKCNGSRKKIRSGGEENDRRMAINVVQGRRVYDGYLAWLDLTYISRQQRQSGLVSFKSCKLESKIRAKVFGKVDTMETYQILIIMILLVL